MTSPMSSGVLAYVDNPTPIAILDLDQLRECMRDLNLDSTDTTKPNAPEPRLPTTAVPTLPPNDPSGGYLRPNNLPVIKEPDSPSSLSTPWNAQTYPATMVSDGRMLAAPQSGTPLSTEETLPHHQEKCNTVVSQMSLSSDTSLESVDSCTGCTDKLERILQLEGEIGMLQSEVQRQENTITSDQCYVLRKIEEIQLLREKLKSIEDEKKRLQKQLKDIQRKYKKLEGAYNLALKEVKAVETLKHRLDKTEHEKRFLEGELLAKCMEQHKYAYKLKVELVHEREEKKELQQMVQTLMSRVRQLEHALNLDKAQ